MPRTATESALLAAVAANPDDDLPRLVYADWCDENGQPERAEFIRTMIEMARMTSDGFWTPMPKDWPTYWTLKMLAEELWEAHREKWYPGLTADRVKCFTRRGFPYGVRLTVGEFQELGERLFQQAPTLYSVMLEDANLATAKLARCPALGRVRRLEFSFLGRDPAIDAARALFRSKHLGGLRSLCLRSGLIGPDGVSAVADCPSLTALEELDLFSQFASDGPVIHLIRQSKFHPLRVFGGSLNQLTDEFAAAFVGADHLVNLRHVDLTGNYITATGIAQLCAARHLSRLERLNLSTNPLGPNVGASLATATFANSLRRLTLRTRKLGKVGTTRLLAGKFPLLEELHLNANPVSEVGVRALAANGGLSSLTKLVLDGCRLSPSAVTTLAGVSSLPAIRELHLGYQPLSDATVRSLVGGPLAQSLDTLGLNVTRMTDAGAKMIAAADLPNLRALSLGGNRITDVGVRALLESKTVHGLRFVALGGSKLSDKVLTMLRERGTGWTVSKWGLDGS